MKKKKKGYLRRFLPYYGHHKAAFLMDLFCCAFTVAAELILPLIARYITSAAGDDPAALSASLIISIGLCYLGLRLLDALAEFYKSSFGHITGAQIEADMRRDLFAHMQLLSYSYYDNTKIGQLMSRITSDLNDVTEFAHHFPEELLSAVLKIGISFAILANTNLPMTLIIFSILPVMLFCTLSFRFKMKRAFQESRHHLGEINAQVEDSLLGIRAVKSFGNEQVESKKFKKNNHKFLSVKRRSYLYMGGFSATSRFFDGLMYITVVVSGAFFLKAGKIDAGDFTAYLLYVSVLLTAIRRIIEFMEQFQRGITGIERFFEVMDVPVENYDAPDALPISDVKGNITFQNASFRYAPDQEYVLKNINLEIAAGQNVALVGPSGSGKTTLCHLIPRFYDLTEGKILLDGTDIQKIQLHSLRDHIGIVQQDVYLFSGSVYDNIAYGCPGASREDIIRAAKQAGAHSFISELEDGYDTYVGERGVKLSGGQKQRISIARVFLKNPPILILDEATSALDNESEHIVQQSLAALAKGRTTFTIAHRLSTIQGADLILVLTEEGIAEQGTHEQLLQKHGIYYDLYSLSAQQK